MSNVSFLSILKRKLSLQVGVFYLITSVVTFSLLAFLIFTNEMQMLTQNAQQESNQLISKVYQAVEGPESQLNQENFKKLERYIGRASLLNEQGDTITSIGQFNYSQHNLTSGVIKAKLFKTVEGRSFYSTLQIKSSEIFYFIPLKEGNFLFVPIYLDQINSQIKSAFIMILIALSMTLLIQFILAAMLNGLVIRPIKILKRLTEKVAQGNYVLYEKITRIDEIGEIAHSFNKMTLTLKENQEHLTAKYKTAKKQANTDPLTGAFNRRAMEDRLSSDIQRHRASQSPLCICIIDIDFFKKVNDTYGHDAGDQCLVQFVNMIESEIKGHDFLARFGGEEFALILHDTTAIESQKIIERIRLKIQKGSIKTKEQEFKITASFGIAELASIHNVAEENIQTEMFKCADSALYQAKEAGRNQSVIFNV